MWSTFYFVQSATMLFILVNLPIILCFSSSITKTALITRHQTTPQLFISISNFTHWKIFDALLLKCIMSDMDGRALIDEKAIIKLNTYNTGLEKYRYFLSHYDLLVVCICLLYIRPISKKIELSFFYCIVFAYFLCALLMMVLGGTEHKDFDKIIRFKLPHMFFYCLYMYVYIYI